MNTTLGTESSSDEQLVEWSLTGDREAFGRIVERYQSLVCSITYGATGSLTLSEDIAQETFLTAWRQLTTLNDATKLCAWLCGIARNLVNNALRRGQREPVQAAEPLETIHEPASTEPSPSAQAVSREEEAILWRALEQMPDTYREPLILFYREQQSVERVAQELELSQDAVKQRLSRGRKLLAEEVAAFVESTLQRTTPGKSFTVGVLAALPVLTASAKAAVIGATAAKGSALAKSSGLVGLATAVLGPAVMFLGTYFGYRLDRDSARSPQMREFVIKYYRILVVCIMVFILACFSLTLCGRSLAKSNPVLFAGLFIGLLVIYVIVVLGLTLWQLRCRQKILQSGTTGDLSPLTGETTDSQLVPLFEYRSKISLLGLPLIHIRIRGGLERGPVKAWIAAGDVAIGIIFAFGGIAFAPVSFGGFAVGLLTLGGLAVGFLPLGGVSLGPWAVGAFAVGWQAFGACAVGWSAAQGGVAVARGLAQGGVALAHHANDAVAQTFFQNSAFFRNALAVMRHAHWLYLFGLLPPALWLWWRVVARKQPARPS